MAKIRLDVRHVGLEMTMAELPLPTDAPLTKVKDTLYPRTGTEPANMQLTLYADIAAAEAGGDGGTALDDDAKSLADYGAAAGMALRLVDTDAASVSNTLNDEAKVDIPKVEAKANSGFAAFRKKAKKKAPPATDDTGKDAAAALSEGMRVMSIKSGKTGTVRFIGPIEPLPKGFWIGVELDDATGRNDGEVKGVRLFQCEANHGAVMRPGTVKPCEAAEGKDGDDEEL